MHLFKFSTLIVFSALTVTAATEELQVGDTAPLFKAVDQDDQAWALQDHIGSKYLVLYFYPAAMTGGCTKQACSYRDYVKSTTPPNIEIIGISGDTPQSLKYFQQAENLNFTLLSDIDGKVADAFGVTVKPGEKKIEREVSGQMVELVRGSTAARSTFIISPQGTIIYRDSKVKATQDQENVIAFLKDTEE